MQALTFHKYGAPEDLKLEDVPQPVPGPGEVLIQVKATSLNSMDFEVLQGKPWVNRLLFGLRRPRRIRSLGGDVAGRVEAAGAGVRRFVPGDEVFGDLCGAGMGGLAQYVCAPEKALARKPDGMRYEEAAAFPQAGVLALQGIRDYGRVQAGQQVLINGAGGGVGTFAVQLAKMYGAEVTAVDSGAKLHLLRGLGADHVLDYTQVDYTRQGVRYDMILDTQAYRNVADYRRALAPGGIFVMVGGSMALVFRLLWLTPWHIVRGRQRLRILMHRPNCNLEDLIALYAAGKLTPVIEGCRPLAEAPQALRRLGEGAVLGKLVITPAGPPGKIP